MILLLKNILEQKRAIVVSRAKLQLLDDTKFDYDIYMNHILNHKGYRFFQASFDPDEKGTVLVS